MSDTDKKGRNRPRKIGFTQQDLALAAKEASEMAARYAALADLMQDIGFTGALAVDGGTQLTDSLAALNELHGRLSGVFRKAITPEIGTPQDADSVPESIPETSRNTRRNVGDSRVLPLPSESTKRKKTP